MNLCNVTHGTDTSPGVAPLLLTHYVDSIKLTVKKSCLFQFFPFGFYIAPVPFAAALLWPNLASLYWPSAGVIKSSGQ